MKNSLAFALICSLILIMGVACRHKTYRYEVSGSVETPKGSHPAIWITDTLERSGDTLSYTNSDGSVVTILPPYTIDTIR